MTRYGFVMRIAARQQWVYRAEMVMRAIQMTLFIGVFMALWVSVFGITGESDMEGYSLVDVVWYLAMTETIALSSSRIFIEISNEVKAGNLAYTLGRPLDYYLTLPADPLLHLLISRTSLPAWGDLLFGLIVFLIAAPGRWLSLPLFLLLGLLIACIMVAFGVLVGSLAFWVGNADNLTAQAINAIITFSLYPVEIFPAAIRVLLYTLIPAAFVGSLPAALLQDFRWERLVMLMAVAAGFVLAARGVFRWGLRRYESGNLVTVRG